MTWTRRHLVLYCSTASFEERLTRSGGRPTMAYAIVHHFPGGTKDQYEKSLAAVHPSRGSLPAGQIFHAAGPSAGGWTIMAVLRLQGELGAIPRPDPHAENEARSRRGIGWAAPGNCIRGSQPAKVASWRDSGQPRPEIRGDSGPDCSLGPLTWRPHFLTPDIGEGMTSGFNELVTDRVSNEGSG